MVDYSKWDKVVLSSDEEEEEEEETGQQRSQPAFSDSTTRAIKTPEGMVLAPPGTITKAIERIAIGKGGPKSGGRTATPFVKIAPEDNGVGLPGFVYGDPKQWKAQPDPEDGIMYYGWGMPEPEDGLGMMRKMQQQFNYGPYSKSGLEYPEEQFFQVVRENWLEQQKKVKSLRDSLLKKDFRFKITLVPFEDNLVDVFRVFRCSGGMTLRALADKVLLPVMGWVRNYHSWCFIRSSDGAWACPTDSGSIDVMHQQLIGFAPFDDRQLKIADFFQAKGDSATFTYDFGDRWVHTLTVEEIYTSEEGSVQVLAGAGACPPEDSCGLDAMGNHGYYGSLAKRSINYRELAGALNYRDRRNFKFDPKYFSLEETRARVTKEIASPASSVSGSKIFQIPLSHLTDKEEPSRPIAEMLLGKAGHGQKVTMDPKTFMTETVRDGSVKDPKNVALCLACGNPNNLKLCSACGIVRYCSRECQVSDWKNHKPNCKKK